MNKLLESLNKYFSANSEEQIMKDWEETKQSDLIGPEIEDFLIKSEIIHYRLVNPEQSLNNFINENINPKFTSGFFLSTL